MALFFYWRVNTIVVSDTDIVNVPQLSVVVTDALSSSASSVAVFLSIVYVPVWRPVSGELAVNATLLNVSVMLRRCDSYSYISDKKDSSSSSVTLVPFRVAV